MIHYRQSLISFNKQCIRNMPEGFVVAGVLQVPDGCFIGYNLRWANWPSGGLLKAVSQHFDTRREAWKAALDMAEDTYSAFEWVPM